MAARQIPTLRCLRDSLVERDKLTANARLSTAEQESPEDAAIRIARAEDRLILTDYPYYPRERPIGGAAGAARIIQRFTAEEDRYAVVLRGIARHTESLSRISRDQNDSTSPFWANDWFPPFDAVSLCGLIAEQSPRRYIEVGSGNSTLFARWAIRDMGLQTKIISVDPHPRAEIDTLCDEVVRNRMEDVPREFWEGIGPSDLLFVDNSHRSFPNSDVTVFFTEVLPALKPGATWGLHDIFLPWDYPEAWTGRYYNEQYLLFAYLLGGADRDEIVLPVKWAMHQPRLHDILAPLWGREELFGGLNINGGCFWMRRRED
jgi:hypothetical protein